MGLWPSAPYSCRLPPDPDLLSFSRFGDCVLFLAFQINEEFSISVSWCKRSFQPKGLRRSWPPSLGSLLAPSIRLVSLFCHHVGDLFCPWFVVSSMSILVGMLCSTHTTQEVNDVNSPHFSYGLHSLAFLYISFSLFVSFP